MKYFLDTEFIESPCTIDLISIGIVSEDGRELYMESNEVNWGNASQWVWDNVVPNLKYYNETPSGLPYKNPEGSHSKEQIKKSIIEFCNIEKYGKPEFWGYYADFDWVVFCWLFGAMIDLPECWPMYCRDIKQLCDDLGNPKLPEQGKSEHNALEDARWNQKAWNFLSNYKLK
jgi:hypothetical protein